MFERVLNEHLECFRRMIAMEDVVMDAGQKFAKALKSGRRILVCGNGGSAADAQHFAAEIVGRFEKERKPWPVIALTTDTSILTAVANDYSYDEVFARQVEGLGTAGDILLGISTSGNSNNVVKAVEKAREMNMGTIVLLGKDGGRMKTAADRAIVAPFATTARIQEAHMFILHIWAEQIETILTRGNE
jgi:D-sedoheptulose 7-phosphate isomerase